MTQQIVTKTAEKLSKYRVIEASMVNICAYGFEVLLSSIAGVTALIIISIVDGKTFFWFPYLLGFVPLRLSGGGYHAKTHFRCLFIFSLLYSIVLIGELYMIQFRAWLVACAINLVIIYFCSPVEASNKPLKECQWRTNRRNSLCLASVNLVGCIALVFLCEIDSSWLNMYFAGNSLAGVSMLFAAITKKNVRRSN